MGFRDALPVCVDECETGNERDDVEERDDDRVAVLERVGDRVSVLDRVVDMVVVGVLVGVRECVGACDGVRLDDGVPAGVGKAVRDGLAVSDDVAAAVADDDVDAVGVAGAAVVIVAEADGDTVAVDTGVGKAVRVSVALGVREPTNVDDADAGCVGNAVRDGDDVCVREPDIDGVCDDDGVPPSDGEVVHELDGMLVADVVGVGDGERRTATLRLRTVAFATPASLASQEYTDSSAPLVKPDDGTSAVTFTYRKHGAVPVAEMPTFAAENE